jgi:hypothetical protein
MLTARSNDRQVVREVVVPEDPSRRRDAAEVLAAHPVAKMVGRADPGSVYGRKRMVISKAEVREEQQDKNRGQHQVLVLVLDLA